MDKSAIHTSLLRLAERRLYVSRAIVTQEIERARAERGGRYPEIEQLEMEDFLFWNAETLDSHFDMSTLNSRVEQATIALNQHKVVIAQAAAEPEPSAAEPEPPAFLPIESLPIWFQKRKRQWRLLSELPWRRELADRNFESFHASRVRGPLAADEATHATHVPAPPDLSGFPDTGSWLRSRKAFWKEHCYTHTPLALSSPPPPSAEALQRMCDERLEKLKRAILDSGGSVEDVAKCSHVSSSVRSSGASLGGVDFYYRMVGGKRFRSLQEVGKFLALTIASGRAPHTPTKGSPTTKDITDASNATPPHAMVRRLEEGEDGIAPAPVMTLQGEREGEESDDELEMDV
jgi:hypothetical protein